MCRIVRHHGFPAGPRVVQVPTLIIHGTKQTVPIDASARPAAKGIAQSTLIEYDGAPHGLLASHNSGCATTSSGSCAPAVEPPAALDVAEAPPAVCPRSRRSVSSPVREIPDLVCLSHVRWAVRVPAAAAPDDALRKEPSRLLRRGADLRRHAGDADRRSRSTTASTSWCRTCRARSVRPSRSRPSAPRSNSCSPASASTATCSGTTRRSRCASRRTSRRRVSPYDCIDELSTFEGAPADLPALERELMRRAGVVFAAGQSLYEARKAQHPNIHAVPGSVDVAHFAAARLHRQDPPDQIPIPRPRLGSFGVLDDELDIPLLQGLADARPDWQLVMIGPVVKIDRRDLPRRPNIHYLGPQGVRRSAALHRRLGRRAAAVRPQRGDAVHQPDQDARVSRRRQAGRVDVDPRRPAVCTANAGSSTSPTPRPRWCGPATRPSASRRSSAGCGRRVPGWHVVGSRLEPYRRTPGRRDRSRRVPTAPGGPGHQRRLTPRATSPAVAGPRAAARARLDSGGLGQVGVEAGRVRASRLSCSWPQPVNATTVIRVPHRFADAAARLVAVHARHADVEQDQRRRLRPAPPPGPLGPSVGDACLAAERANQHGHRVGGTTLSSTPRGPGGGCAVSPRRTIREGGRERLPRPLLTGNRMVKVLPRPAPSLRASIVPPCISISRRASASPMPSPVCERLPALARSWLNRSKTRGSISGRDAHPRVGDGQRQHRKNIRHRPPRPRAPIAMRPPASVNFTALCSTFEITWTPRVGSVSSQVGVSGRA